MPKAYLEPEEIERRKELISRARVLTVDEIEELQAILYKELHYDHRVGKIGLLAYLALHAIISYMSYCLKMEVMADGSSN